MTETPRRHVRARERVHPRDQRRDLTKLFALDRDTLDTLRHELAAEHTENHLDDLLDAYVRPVDTGMSNAPDPVAALRRWKWHHTHLLAAWLDRWHYDHGKGVIWTTWRGLVVEVHHPGGETGWRFDVFGYDGSHLYAETGYASPLAAMIDALDPVVNLLRDRRDDR